MDTDITADVTSVEREEEGVLGPNLEVNHTHTRMQGVDDSPVMYIDCCMTSEVGLNQWSDAPFTPNNLFNHSLK